MTIVEFLLARVEEDEALARSASPGPWHVDAESTEVLAVDGIVVADGFALSGPQTRATTAHIARHDPARVLSECAAKRAVLGLLTVAEQHVADVRRSASEYRFVSAAESPRDAILCAVQLLAAVYADHPEFDPAWRMTTV